ncbi:SUMF1/EgtB/PvdO family nonheme iron enzyme [Vineibacter terrae]|uniref:SUMF1/EgtB/PvdO family nonheme iron enzyme n=1 Tax=Vineibacter terrae TaxID=2586908 RepID=UPI002E3382F0|nr:SUMF1/EgtB/PvdO family nonheme iron enzyme [Vineibacter terrae]HEX2886380.1 SUMF1/EgtB/PvdO family nonheme iron enzyme [Vineibacter terrae]
MLRALALAAMLVSVLLAPSPSHADRRVALVIGNGAYTQAAPLTNPANDARAVAAALERLGFEVVSGFDVSNADLRKAVRSFADKLVGADVALFFYAGHGLQVAGENYLIPIDAAIRNEADLDFNAVKMDLVSRQMDREAKVKIIMLDACRDNPFQKELSRSMSRTRSATVKQGLAEISNTAGTLIAFATDPGSVALDGDGQHSPFTAALLKHIETPGIEIGLMMRRVTKDVFEATGERQRPWTNASLTGELYLKPGAPAAVSAPSDAALELAVWQTLDKGGQAADYEEYLKKYPNGQFAGVARRRLEALRTGADVKQRADATARHQSRDCEKCPELVHIPPGSFVMGAAPDEHAREGVPEELARTELPQHKVTIAYAFSMGRNEVTRGEFAAFVEATGRQMGNVCYGAASDGRLGDIQGGSWRTPGFPQTDRDPVVCVTWADASAYVGWLSRETGKTYRLPTEAEWEYAARAGTTFARYWGDSPQGACRHGNFADLGIAAKFNWPRRPESIFMCDDGHAYTARVGTFAANAFGLHDMLGNVWEWTSDCWNETYAAAPATGAARTDGDCSRRVGRGSSWYNAPKYSRAASRSWFVAGNRFSFLGFRIARTD